MGNKINLALVGIIGLLLGATVATAIHLYYYPGTATVTSTSLTLYLDDEQIPNSTVIGWDLVEAGGEYYYENLTVHNTGTTTYTIILVTLPPQNWIETWTGNNSLLQPDETVQGPFNLTVPADAADGEYSWDRWLIPS